MDTIYLDNNSTTVIDPLVADSMYECMQKGYVNPASQHSLGRTARRELELARESIAANLGAHQTGMKADQLIFTSGGTESNNLALRGLIEAACTGDRGSINPGSKVLVSAIEHPSVMAVADLLEQRGVEIGKIPVDRDGVVEIDALDELIDQRTKLLSVMLVNNETGAIQPVADIAKKCRQRGVVCHTDAVQAVGKMPVSFADLDVDALTFTAHKLHGPRGIGGLLLRHGVKLHPLIVGGFQQGSLRPGTEDVPLAVGFAKAIEIALSQQVTYENIGELRDRFERELTDRIPETVIQSAKTARVVTTSNIAFPGIDRQALVMAADMQSIAISTGSACASGSSEPSPVLIAMGCEQDVILGAVRISFSRFTIAEELSESVERISRIHSHLRQLSNA
jgi:cysteine desulfurase